MSDEQLAVREVPLIPAPAEDTIDDAASREAADIGAGRLSLQVVGSTRHMTAYTITSTELDGLSTWGVIANTSYTISSGFGSFSLGLLMQAIFSDFSKLPALAQAICYVGVPIGVILAIASFLVGRYLSSKKQGLQRIIENQTNHDN